jgi:putative hydrolases of HD superfamily
MDEKEIIRFLFEAGMLKTVDRSGWSTIRAPRESVAEHSHRTAIIAYVLARFSELSKEDELRLIKAALLHDLHETRLGDMHIITKRYVKADEKQVEKDQIENLPKHIREDIEDSLNLDENLKQLLIDADKLECAITAKEYLDLGYKSQDWIENTKKRVQSEVAKKLLVVLEQTDSLHWLSRERRLADY